MNQSEAYGLVSQSGVYGGVVALLLTLGSGAQAARITVEFPSVLDDFTSSLASERP